MAEARGTRPRSAWEAVYAVVRRIPRGRVMTYGQISLALKKRRTGPRLSPAAVGWALHVCPPDVPWHRVVNARGGCSTERLATQPRGMQQTLLEDEGVAFRADGTLDLARHAVASVRPPSARSGGPVRRRA